MSPEEYKKLRTRCDELALQYFDRSNDLAAVSFRLKEVIESALRHAGMRDAREKRERARGDAA
jgi:septal ring factor EnvC (AmiA/AmiB activator)